MENEMHVGSTTNAPAARPERTARRAAPHAPQPPPGDPSLREILRTLAAARWLILFCTLAAAGLALAYLLLAHPVYRSTALLEVDDAPNPMATLEALPPAPGEGETHDRNVERIRARSVVGPVVDRLGLAVVAEPHRFPVVGGAMARRWRGSEPAPAPFAFLSRYAFGGERIALTRIDVPEELVGEPLTVVALEGGRYRLVGPEGEPLATGEVGAAAAPVSGAPAFDLVVSQLVARPGTEFRILADRRDDAIEAVLKKLVVGERGKKSGLIEVTLDGNDPRKVAAITGAIVSEYVRQDAERRRDGVTRTLALVQGQLATLKTRLETAETALSEFKTREGMPDLAVETRVVLERVADLQKQLADLETERAQLGAHHGEGYPEMSTLSAKAGGIRGALAALGDRMRALPGTELRMGRLTRDVTVATEQYVSTLGKIQALQVVGASEGGTVRVLDAPVVAHRPVAPKPVPTVLLGLLLGVSIGVAGAFVRRSLASGDDSHEIEAATGLPIFVTVPHSDAEAKLQREARGKGRAPLAEAVPDDVATESLRTLRTVLGFLLKARGNVVAVSSPAPGSGKTFVAANLAHLLAAAGKRVLLVDGDLRRGTLHRYFSVDEAPGLSDVLAGTASTDEATRHTGTAGLDLLVCGRPAAHPAELLSSPRLDEVMSALSKKYDVVLVDTAPTLAVTDAVLVGRCASLNLLVLRARQEPVSEISLALERFARSGVQVHGAIVNDVRPGGRYARTYEHRNGSGEAPVVALN